MDLRRSSALLIAGMYCLLERAFSGELARQRLSIKFLSSIPFPLAVVRRDLGQVIDEI